MQVKFNSVVFGKHLTWLVASVIYFGNLKCERVWLSGKRVTILELCTSSVDLMLMFNASGYYMQTLVQ